MANINKQVPKFSARARGDEMPRVDITDLVHITDQGELWWDPDEIDKRYWAAARQSVNLQINLGVGEWE